MGSVARLLSRPVRLTVHLTEELLRFDAAALGTIGSLARSVSEVVRESLHRERAPHLPDPLAPMPAGPLERPTRSAPRNPPALPSQAAPRPSPRTEPRVRPAPTAPAPKPRAPVLPAAGSRERPQDPSEAPGFSSNGRVDEEVVLVSASADPGAEDGAGANVHVQKPWEGYGAMRAREIIDRVPALSDEVLSLVLLYENTGGRARRTVIEAAERELARRSASS